jgi:hypothetical protein
MRKPNKKSLFRSGIVKTQQEDSFPAGNTQNPLGIRNSCRVLVNKTQSRMAK